MTEQLGFDGRVAIVTGGGGGLGREHALMLASRGALVVVNDLGGAVDGTGSDKGAAERVVDEIKRAGGEAVADTNSVATAEGGAAIVQTALDAYEHVDIVINNAGILRDKAFHNMTPEQFESVLDVHLRGAFHVTQPAWPHLRKQNYGRVVLTSSAAGVFGNFGQVNYGAAKMALVGFANALAIEGVRYNILANAITPVAETRMTEDLIAGGGLAGKIGSEYVAPLVTYLCHESCEATGRVFTVGGGRVAEVFIAEGPGFVDVDLSPESIRDHWDEVVDQDGYTVPRNANDELRFFLKQLGSRL
ncbi:MAG TPA: short-chain dehydrogenase [Acidimicrobiaceae bacterium]|nr:short-chain dehydrogenase [Acidimicrobiaceae bacterium]